MTYDGGNAWMTNYNKVEDGSEGLGTPWQVGRGCYEYYSRVDRSVGTSRRSRRKWRGHFSPKIPPERL